MTWWIFSCEWLMMKRAGVTPHGPNGAGRRTREVGTTWYGHQLVQLRLQPRDLLAQLNVVHPAQRKHKRGFSAADMPTLRTLDALRANMEQRGPWLGSILDWKRQSLTWLDGVKASLLVTLVSAMHFYCPNEPLDVSRRWQTTDRSHRASAYIEPALIDMQRNGWIIIRLSIKPVCRSRNAPTLRSHQPPISHFLSSSTSPARSITSCCLPDSARHSEGAAQLKLALGWSEQREREQNAGVMRLGKRGDALDRSLSNGKGFSVVASLCAPGGNWITVESRPVLCVTWGNLYGTDKVVVVCSTEVSYFAALPEGKWHKQPSVSDLVAGPVCSVNNKVESL